jgi:hypothetical protein
VAERCSRACGHGLLALALLASASSCGGDYWLGGERGSGARSPTQSLVGDWALVGPGDVEIGGSGPCRIAGNGFGIVTEDGFSGQIWIHDCELTGLGSESKPALDLSVAGPGSVRIERCTFARSGPIQIANGDDTSTTFADNWIHADARVPLDPSAGYASSVFYAFGASPAPKTLRGNRIERGRLRLASAAWLVGGDTDAETNLLTGLRAGITLEAGGLVVRGNYVHPDHLTGAGDESCIDTDYSVTDALAEHNVLRGGTWVVRGFGGELRDNALLDADDLAFLQQPFEGTRVHHNVMAMCAPARGGDVQAGIELVNARPSGIEIFNNTLDGGGDAVRFGGPAVSIESGSFIASLRNDLFEHFFLFENQGAAAVRPGPTEGSDPAPVRLDYADYNLFDNTGESTPVNYAVTVAGRSLRADPGFALHDALPGGAVDEQVPALLAEAGACFPFSDDDIGARRVTVSDLLAALRARYAPLAGSPALGGGDPADGPGSFIGAVGDGASPDDAFGTFGR